MMRYHEVEKNDVDPCIWSCFVTQLLTLELFGRFNKVGEHVLGTVMKESILSALKINEC
jgi:hypothetical protein